MYKQLIIARKDLNKLAAQVSHAFLLEKILWGSKEVVRERDGIMYHMDISLDTDLFHDWITGAETKVVCRAKNEAEEIIIPLRDRMNGALYSLCLNCGFTHFFSVIEIESTI